MYFAAATVKSYAIATEARIFYYFSNANRQPLNNFYELFYCKRTMLLIVLIPSFEIWDFDDLHFFHGS